VEAILNAGELNTKILEKLEEHHYKRKLLLSNEVYQIIKEVLKFFYIYTILISFAEITSLIKLLLVNT